MNEYSLPLLKFKTNDNNWNIITGIKSVKDLGRLSAEQAVNDDDIDLWDDMTGVSPQQWVRILEVETADKIQQYGFTASRIYLCNGSNGKTIDTL